MPVFEGKYHLTYDGYCLLAEALFTAEHVSQMLFGWPFLVLPWNLIARTATVSSMMSEHVSWEGDALLVSTPKHKGDQEGAKCFSRHLYANPLHPVICPVLALAVLTFMRVLKHDPQADRGAPSSSASPPNYRIFDGAHSESRFSEVLGRAIASLSEGDLSRLGGGKKQLGTHSVRKGAASYCAGMINGPSTVQVFLRAGWSLGNVQDRYLFAGAGGDQLTGRVLSGLPFNDSSFSSLPPHFGQDGLDRIQWDSILPLYSTPAGDLQARLTISGCFDLSSRAVVAVHTACASSALCNVSVCIRLYEQSEGVRHRRSQPLLYHWHADNGHPASSRHVQRADGRGQTDTGAERRADDEVQ